MRLNIFSSNFSVKEAALEYYKLVLNILCMTQFVMSSSTVLEAAIMVRWCIRENRS